MTTTDTATATDTAADPGPCAPGAAACACDAGAPLIVRAVAAVLALAGSDLIKLDWRCLACGKRHAHTVSRQPGPCPPFLVGR